MSPRTKIQTEEIRNQSRRNFIEVSLRLFGTYGYASTSISDIVTAVGCSKGLFYHYFNSKEDLLRQMIDDLIEAETKILEEMYADDPRKLMFNLLSFFFREMRENFEQWRLIMNLSVQVEKYEFVHDLAVGKMKGYLQLFEELLERMGWENPKSEARLLAAIFDGIGFQYLVLKEDFHLTEMENILIDKYCR